MWTVLIADHRTRGHRPDPRPPRSDLGVPQVNPARAPPHHSDDGMTGDRSCRCRTRSERRRAVLCPRTSQGSSTTASSAPRPFPSHRGARRAERAHRAHSQDGPRSRAPLVQIENPGPGLLRSHSEHARNLFATREFCPRTRDPEVAVLQSSLPRYAPRGSPPRRRYGL